MTTLQAVELGVLGPLRVRQDGVPVAIPGAKPRAVLTMLGLHHGSVVSADTLVELLWGEDPPRTAAKALQTHISALRRALGDGFVLTQGTGWALAESEVDASRYKSAARLGRDAAATGDIGQAVARFEEALALWRGIPELPDGRRGTSEKTRWIEGHAALVEDRADALLATARAAEIIGELEAAVAEAPLRERRWGQLMLALYRAGRQGDALGAYQRARTMLADELGIDPGPELRRLETAIVAQDASLDVVVAQNLPSVMRAVTFLLTDIEGSTAAWEADAEAMAVALARHDELAEQVVTSRGGRLIKTRGEGDATFSVFERPSAAAAAAMELQDAISREQWNLREPMRIRIALHTGEVELRDGDYFGRAVNRAARLRSLAAGGQILCSGATAELVIDSLPDDVVLADLGLRELRNLARPEHVFELRLETAEESDQPPTSDAPMERPGLPSVLIGTGPFVGRGSELERLLSAWQTSLGGGACAALIAGEPGVGKTRLAGEWSRQAYEQGAVVLYGRCDEDLGAPYQPFAEALRSMVPCVGTSRLRGLRGVEALLPLVPGLVDEVPDLAAPTRADPDTERYALFDAVVALLELASTEAPVVLVLDDLHWAAKPTLLLLRHLLRFGDRARVQIVGTYRSTDLDRSHPLAAMLADLHRDGTASRISLSGLDEDDVSAYVAKAGYDDEELGHALASVTGGNPFFLIEALRHVDESGGVWDPSTLPQGVREAVSRRLTRLPIETNKALAAAAVVGSRFSLDLVERVVGDDLVDAFDEASKAGIVIEEPGGRYRFNHAIVRQSLLAELPSMRRMRLHQRIATTLEEEPGADDELLAELAHHYFECAWAGNAAKAVEYCRRAADQAMARLAYEGAADLYDHALHALDEIDDELPDRDDQVADLLLARCEALLAAGDVASASGAVSQLQQATVDSARLSAWATCFDGQLSVLVHPERLDDVEAALGAAAQKLAEIDDAAGEAKAHTVRATCLARLGRIGDCEIALDDALTAARRAREHRRVNAVLAGAPLAALWGPNPVPRAGGRCLDVVRLLRITTDSPAVEATSTRCQAVLEAFRGRDAAARRMIDSARRTVTELGLRHALLEVEQFAGIVELVLDDPAAAEPHLRQAYNGFRRMGLDADTAETAALLGRACLALNRDAEADELCTESERLAGHALKASIAWRTLRAQLLSRGSDHEEARRVAQAAITLAERTDGLIDHGDACLSLATVLGAAGDAAGARAAAERAVDLYERKGAAALAEKARSMLDDRTVMPPPAPPEAPPVIELDTACVRAGERVAAALNDEDWDEFEQLFAPEVFVESRRKIVGFTQIDLPSKNWAHENRRVLEALGEHERFTRVVIAVRGERLALDRIVVGNADVSPGAPQDEFLALYGIDKEGRIALQIWLDLEDIDAAMAELDAVHARFEDERSQARRLENTASRVIERVYPNYAARDWDALAQMTADTYSIDDRRRMVNTGIRRGRDAGVKELRAAADVGFTMTMLGALATRGERLVLTCARVSGRDPETIQNDALNVFEIDADEKIVAAVVFDLDDFDAAIAELDARYLAGEAGAYAHTWSVISQAYAALNRHEFPATAPDWINIDHRGETAFGPDDLIAYIRAGLDLDQDVKTYVAAVHRLSHLGVVVTYAAHETSKEGFDAEWRGVAMLTIEGDMVNRSEVFDEAGIDAALARFEELNPPARRLENTASRVIERVYPYYAARDWDAMAQMAADNYSIDDRRRMVNVGIRHGRDAGTKELQATADVGFTMTMLSAMATRGDRLALTRIRGTGRDPETIQIDALNVVEIDADEKVVAVVVFDLEDFDAAIAELDARYLSGEAAAYAHTWSVLTEAYAAFSRHELPAITPDCVFVDHRRAAAFGAIDLSAYLRAGWDLGQNIRPYFEAVHRLSDLGAVCSYAAHGVSHEGFDAEWQGVSVATVDGEMVNHTEFFDETDLDAALARFDQLSRPAPRLENAASQAVERFLACFAARDWDAFAEILADDISTDDRRRVVNAGIRHDRDAELKDFRSAADLGVTTVTSDVIAARGQRLVLTRSRLSRSDEEPEPFHVDLLWLVEIDANRRVTAWVTFELEDFDAAVEELDARYLAGEAAAYERTWSAISGSYAAINRHEQPATTADWVDVDHRREIAMRPGDMVAYFEAGSDRDQDFKAYVEAVHRLTDPGAVVTYAAYETSQEGFDAEWRGIAVLTVEGDMVSRTEVFDEGNLDAAIATFDQLSRPAPRLANAASQAYEGLQACFAARDWDAMTEILAADISTDDRRRVVGEGRRQSRDAVIAEISALVEIGVTSMTPDTIAIRGGQLVLSRVRSSGRDQRPDSFGTDVLDVLEIDAEGRVVARVVFDLDDFDAAIAELDARYVAGEAAAHSETWSVIAEVYAALNRGEMPATAPDLVDIDHRSLAAIGSGDLMAYLQAASEDAPRSGIYIETVHRLTDLGAVTTHVAKATSREGFDAEWRITSFFIVGGDRINRYEIFDEADLEAALARFDELHRQPPRLENTASQIADRVMAHFTAREWDAATAMLADDFSSDDRRRTVNAGLRRGRDAAIKDANANADLGAKEVTSTVIATRGDRLVLRRARYSGSAQRPEGFYVDALSIYEINGDGRVAANVTFDIDDIDAAFEELDARYLAGEAAPHARTWSLMAQTYAMLNRHEIPPTEPDWVNMDHRRAIAFAPGDIVPYVRAVWESAPDTQQHIVAVHRLTTLGAVITQQSHGTSQQGLEAESQEIGLFTFDGDLATRCEIFDEAALDDALARFDELSRPTPRLENAATRTLDRVNAYFAARDWAALGAMMAQDVVDEDRRRVANAGVRHDRDAVVGGVQTAADLGAQHIASTAIATRGDRLALCRFRYSGRDQRPEAFYSEALGVFEIDVDERVVAHVAFDLEDIDAAFEELDARYLAGEAAAHARTWSVITRSNTAANRNARLPMTPDSSIIDHRLRTTLNADGLIAYVRASWDLTPELHMFIESVHRLNDVGVVVTHASRGTSQDDFEAEWRQITLFTVEGDLCNRCEIFDEAILDTALARFDELQAQTRCPENTASRASRRYLERFVARDWDTMADMLADDYYTDDRRHVVGGGIHGRDAEIASVQAQASLGVTHTLPTPVAVRGERLALSRVRYSGGDEGLETFSAEMLIVFELNPEDRFAAAVAFDLDDIDAAFAELDARYLADEAAAHAHTWSVIAGMYTSFNRHELPATTSDWVTVDRRPVATFEFRDANEFFRSTWDLTPHVSIHAEAVHRLTSLGAVVTHVVHGTSEDGFDAEWRISSIVTVKGDLISGCELFDDADLDAALARFEELHPRSGRLEHPVQERFLAHFAARDWDAMGQDFADDYYCDDRRRVVNAGVRHGRDAAFEDLRVAAEIGLMTNITSDIIATRGERVFLGRTRWLGPDQRTEDFYTEVLNVVEIDPEERIAAQVLFDPNDIGAAIKELDARYLAGEASAHPNTWSLIARAFAAINRHELPELTPDWVNVDHRRGAAFAAGEMTAYIHDLFDDVPDIHVYPEVVHRLGNLGAVVTQAGHGTSQEGFQAEWREVGIFMFDGDMVCRFELFDEADLDAALARFEELQPQAPRLENAASQVEQRFLTYFAARDWDAYAEILSDDVCIDDRRHVVNAGVRHGRDAEIANVRALADIGVRGATSTVIAVRGERLFLGRHCVWGGWSDSEASETLCVLEINAENQIVARVLFDADDIDAAFAELDARYLAGEAAAAAHTWSVIMQTCAAIDRREMFATTKDFVDIDHRSLAAIGSGDLMPYIRAALNDGVYSIYIEAVHRLSGLGAVVALVARGTSQGGFEAEWRMTDIFTVEGDLISRCEIFDDADLDAALARFEELQPQAPRLENAASQVYERFQAHFATSDWDAIADMLTADLYSDDRRPVVGGGIRPGRDALIEDLRAVTDVEITNATSDAIATRGGRLALARARYSRGPGEPDSFHVDFLQLVEIDAEDRITAFIAFDPDDIDAAFEELDARYLAGEVGAYAATWSVIARFNDALNRQEIPPTDWVTIDHRPLITADTSDLPALIRDVWGLTPDLSIQIEAVHQLSSFGAVVTRELHGTSREGFEAEWRMIQLLAVEGDRISRSELFDEADLDTALARFDELQHQARLENLASQAAERYLAHFAAGDWNAMAEMLADNYLSDDRRPVVGAGVRRGRDAQMSDMRAIAEVWLTNVSLTVIATRGERLILTRSVYSGHDQGSEAFHTEVLAVGEIDADERIAASVSFDPDDIDAAFEELDARYLAGEAAAHSHTWSVITQAYTALNRRKLPPAKADWVNVDHRQGIAFAPGDMTAYIRAGMDLAPDTRIYIETVHRLNSLGAVITQVLRGTSHDGFDAEWREIGILTFEGDLISRSELYDEADLDAALARFDELERPASP